MRRRLKPNQCLAINRAAALDTLHGDAQLAGYQRYWAARAVLLARIGSAQAAAAADRRAIGLESDAAVRRFLQGERART